jgi:general secretion pathway protein D
MSLRMNRFTLVRIAHVGTLSTLGVLVAFAALTSQSALAQDTKVAQVVDTDKEHPVTSAEDPNAVAKRKEQYEIARKKAIEGAKAKANERAATTGAATGDKSDPKNLAQAGKPENEGEATPPAATPKPTSTNGSATGATKAEEKAATKVDLGSCKPATGKLAFNFEKATINEVLDQISRIRCMNFILSDAVKGKNDITIVSRSPVSVGQAYAAFLSALEANGMALVPAGAFWKVVERKESAKTTIPMYEIKDGVLQRLSPDEKREGDFPNSDAQVTLLYDIKYANKDQVQNLVRNLMSKNADLQTPVGSMFILTDSGSNILRILEVLDKVDVEGTSNRLNVVTVQYADVASISQKLNEIFGVGASGEKKATSVAKRSKTPKADAAAEGAADGAANEESGDITDVAIEKIIPDERSNQLLIISSPKAFEKVLEVLRILDVPDIDGGTGEVKMFVVPLANMDAQKAEATLSALAQGSAAKKPTADKGGAKAKEAAQAASLFEGEVKVKADETTNSLVVVATGRDFRALKSVIEKLDVRRPQVFVEAAIMEVALNQNRSVGLNAYASTPIQTVGGTGIGIIANEGGRQLFQDSAKAVAGQQALAALVEQGRLDGNTIGPVVDAASNLSSLLGFLAFQGPGVEVIPGLTLPSVGAVLNLLQSNTNVDILSTPHIMTTDNEKAEISVGQRVPVVRGIAPVGGAGSLGLGGLQQVAYEDVKLKFAITPHVNSDGEVRIELEQEVSDLGGQVSVGNGLTQPIITNRNVKNVVVAKDQQTIAIAGLISDRKGDTESKIPFFGDIPIIGWLFKTWTDNKSKTNLLIVLTPYIVRNDEDFRKIYERKMNERREFVEAYFSDARVYNPYIDYDKKTGPVGELSRVIDYEMKKIENGGPGHGEQLIGPGDSGFGVGRGVTGGDTGNGGGDAPPIPDGDGDAPESAPPPSPPADVFEPPAPPPPPAEG